MTETTEAAARTITDRYVAVWNEPDAQSRRTAIGSLWEPDGVEYVDGGIQFRGHEELDRRIAHAYDEFVGSGKYYATMADDASRHDDVITFTCITTRTRARSRGRPASSSSSARQAASGRAAADGHPRQPEPGVRYLAAGSASDPAALPRLSQDVTTAGRSARRELVLPSIWRGINVTGYPRKRPT